MDGVEAVMRGLSETGGLYVPEASPDAIDLQDFVRRSEREQMALIMDRFLPSFGMDAWRTIVDEAFNRLSSEDAPFELPIRELGPYYKDTHMILGDHMPTGSLDDIGRAVFDATIGYVMSTRTDDRKPLIIGVMSEDEAAASLASPSGFRQIIFVNEQTPRASELAAVENEHATLLTFDGTLDEAQDRLRALAMSTSSVERLRAHGWEPIFYSPGHLLAVLTAGAMAAVAMGAILARTEGTVEAIDFIVPKDDLRFAAGLVYISSLELPVGTIYVGEGESSALRGLLSSGRLTDDSRRNHRTDIYDPAWPINLERMLFEIFHRDVERLGNVLEAPVGGHWTLSNAERDLLRHAMSVERCDYKRALSVTVSIYDRTDYVVDRTAAEAIRCWEQSGERTDGRPCCFVLERSPLIDASFGVRALFGSREAKRSYAHVVETLSHEAGCPVWDGLRATLDGERKVASKMEGTMEEAVWDALDEAPCQKGADSDEDA